MRRRVARRDRHVLHRERRPDGAEWFTPTDHARGPWDADACHGGPPTGLLVRALERALPEAAPGPHLASTSGARCRWPGSRSRPRWSAAGRATGNTRAAIVDGDGKVRVTATGMHVAVSPTPLFDGPLDNSGAATPRLADAVPGAVPDRARRPRPARLPPAPSRSATRPARTTARAPRRCGCARCPLLPDEEPSPFQRISPLADCGNAFSRHADPDQVQFVNTDLVIALHRDPVGEWMGSRSVATWQPTGVGLADALLFDDEGPVGRALQTLLLRPVG